MKQTQNKRPPFKSNLLVQSGRKNRIDANRGEIVVSGRLNLPFGFNVLPLIQIEYLIEFQPLFILYSFMIACRCIAESKMHIVFLNQIFSFSLDWERMSVCGCRLNKHAYCWHVRMHNWTHTWYIRWPLLILSFVHARRAHVRT